MMNPLPLLSVASDPQLLVVEAKPKVAAEAVTGWADAGLTVRVVRGRKMRTWGALHDEFAAALQFPWYFGENADALSDCLTDLDWLPRQAGYVIVIADPDEVLGDAEPDALQRLASLLGDAAEQWAQAVEEGEWWDRPAIPFHVVLHAAGDAAAVIQRWSATGATVVPFPR